MNEIDQLKETIKKQQERIKALRYDCWYKDERIKHLENRCISFLKVLKENGLKTTDNDCVFNKSGRSCHALSYKSCAKCSFYKSSKEWEREDFDEESQTGGFIHAKTNSI